MGAAVGKELFHRIRQEAVFAMGHLGEIAAEFARIVGKAGDELRSSDDRAALGQSDETGSAGAYALHRTHSGFKLLYVHAGG